ncbi:PAS domain-containing protein [Sphingomonas sp. RB3P16]|uniref:GAF domain-containing hybrid sensor histidine kinase/response regulator n=1 Tax=Parasphingomonas frigoris TaxID=3096163 RepID=UPI002FCB77CA
MNRTFAEGAVVLAPRGRDGSVATAMLAEAGLVAETVPDLIALAAALRRGAGFAIITEEALRGGDLRDLAGFLGTQEEWSDFPFILLTERGGGLERNPGAVRLLETLGNVTFLERPFHPTTLVSLAKAALRARLRQYQARARLEEIRDGQASLKLALAAGGLGTWAIDAPALTLTAAPECKAQFGRPQDAAFDYADLIATIHPQDRDPVERAIAHSIETGGDFDIEHRCIWPDGSLHWIQFTGRAERDRKGAIRRLVGVSHEISERRNDEIRQRALLELGDALRHMTDPDRMSFLAARILGETMGVSRAGYGTIDPVRETITVKRDWNMPGIDSLAGTLHFRDYGSYIEDLKRGELTAIADVRRDPRTAATADALEAISARAFINMPIVDGGHFVALLYLNHVAVRPWSDDDIAFIRDVANRTQSAIERRRAETELATLAESLEREVAARTRERDRTWQNSQDLLAVVDADGCFRAVNPAWTEILGWAPREVVGREHIEFIHGEDVDASEAAHLRAQRGTLRQFENRVRHKDGSYRWVSWVASAGDGLVYASGRHITPEKEARLELEGAQEQLRQAQKMEAVGQLTGGIAHDFNNLLTAISGSLELMQVRVRQGRSADVERYIEAAQQAARRAAALTHRLLAFSRRQTLDPRPTNINRLIVSMDDLLRRSVGPTIELEVVQAGGLWTAQIDPNQLENALLNLCINARDAMPDGGRITVETANKWLDAKAAADRRLPPGQYVSLCVTDTGSGMSPETIERAFDPFFTTKPLGEGTGLGLSMIYGFVRQSGGQVRIYSELGQGTTMCLYFPRVIGADTTEEVVAPSVEPLPLVSGETVLVVDDEAAVRMLVTDVLGEIGCNYLEAADGPSGLAILESTTRIDLLITDVGLPKGMNGRQLADAARVHRPDLKILFITGYAENAVIGNGHLDAGMHILTKPFPMETMGAKIRELIGQGET